MQINTKLKQAIIFSSFLGSMLATGLSSASFMDGCYVNANGGANWLKTQMYRVRDQNAPLGTTVDLRNNSGWNGGIAIGSQAESYRLEAAMDFLSNSVKNATAYFPRIVPLSASGRVRATTLLVNGYYDFKPQTSWTPYLGLGLGVANIHPNVSAFEPESQVSAQLRDDSTEFAYQGIAGVSWSLAKRVKVNLDYRYLRTSTATFGVSSSASSGGGGGEGIGEGEGGGGEQSTVNRPIVKARYASSRVVAGLAYYFD